MVYELRSYDLAPEQLERYLAWAEEKALPLLQGRFGFRVVGFWRAVAKSGEAMPASNVHWLIAWTDEAEMDAAWAAARASVEWQELMAGRVDERGARIEQLRRQSVLLRGIPRSTLQ